MRTINFDFVVDELEYADGQFLYNLKFNTTCKYSDEEFDVQDITYVGDVMYDFIVQYIDDNYGELSDIAWEHAKSNDFYEDDNNDDAYDRWSNDRHEDMYNGYDIDSAYEDKISGYED